MFSSRRLVRSVLFSIAPGAAGGAVAARDIAGRHYYRPTDPKIAAKYAGQFPKVQLFRIDDVFGGWAKAQKTPFNDGGVFDQIYAKK